MPLFPPPNLIEDERPCMASIYMANSGAPTHTSDGGFQHMGGGGGTDTWTIAYDLRDSGLSSQCDTTSGSAHLICRKTGIYLISYNVYLTSMAAASYWGASLYFNGALVTFDTRTNATASTVVGRSQISGLYELSSGDTIEPYVWQNDTASEAYDVTNSFHNRISFAYYGPSS